MGNLSVVQQRNRELARQINDEARTNLQSPYAGKFVGLANGQVALAPTSKPAQSLKDWTRVYESLSEGEVEEIDKIIKTRANLTRPLP